MLIADACHILSCLPDLPSKFTLACSEAPDIAYSIRGLQLLHLGCPAVCSHALSGSTAPTIRAQSSEAALREAIC